MCGPVFFTCIPTQSARLAFVGEKLVLEKSKSPFILFYLKNKNKTRKKNPKEMTSYFKKNVSLKSPSLDPGIRLLIGKVPQGGSTPLSPKEVSTGLVKGNMTINRLIWRYLGRLKWFRDFINTSMPNKKKSNHNHKGELGCALKPLLKCFHKIVKVSSGILAHNMHFYQKQSNDASWQSRTTSIIDIAHNALHIVGFWKMGDRERT